MSRLTAFTVVLLLAMSVLAAHAITIARNGQAQAAIVVASDAAAADRHAAGELADFLG
jgi:hypothetical protein